MNLSVSDKMNSALRFRRFCFGLVFLCAWAGTLSAEGHPSQSPTEDSRTLPGLGAAVRVTFDLQGTPTIEAASRADAMRALGYVTARDRLFQMDWLRRQSAGTLSEVFGGPLLDSDIQQRVIGLRRAAHAIAAHLPDDQRTVLEAYSSGVNAFLQQADSLPFEFHLLGYTPGEWTVEDSLLVVLGIFQMLSWMEEDERMVTIMQQTLPSDVFSFLTWDLDRYTRALLRDREDVVISQQPPSIPVQALAALRQPSEPHHAKTAAAAKRARVAMGSNSWAVGGAKTVDGRAILANDMHLPVTVPNLWYRVRLRYGTSVLTGIVMPGIPAVIVGTNGHVAWGLTDLLADLVDLVRIELHPDDPGMYRVANEWKPFELIKEVISVKGGLPETVEVKTTMWGPVVPRQLMGQPVAVRWIALDPQAVDLGLIHMDRVRTIDEAVQTMNRARGPAANVILADDRGRIAWTVTGRIPIRRGFSGQVSMSWADGEKGWTGYISPKALPKVIDPPSGFFVSTNHRMVGEEYPYVIGHDFDNGYRAFRITERLRELSEINEKDMLALQLDTASHFYRFYQQLALDVLAKQPPPLRDFHRELRETLEAWNGRADIKSVGFGLVVQFRNLLEEKVFPPFLGPSREQDSEFYYGAGDIETPLQQLLTAKIPALLPDPSQAETWDDFILTTLEESAKQMMESEQKESLVEMTWGNLNRPTISHLLTRVIPHLSGFLDMPIEALPGCERCVRVTSGTVGVSERLIVSPGHLEDGIFEMPGGQSGDPLSIHYRDQHQAWTKGLPTPLLPGAVRQTLTFHP